MRLAGGVARRRLRERSSPGNFIQAKQLAMAVRAPRYLVARLMRSERRRWIVFLHGRSLPLIITAVARIVTGRRRGQADRGPLGARKERITVFIAWCRAAVVL